MKIKCSAIAFMFLLMASKAYAFDVTTIAKVVYIDEWDVGFTRIEIDKPTSCGGTWIWMRRDMENYDMYLSRALAALMAGREIRVTERAPAYCTNQHLYNARIGNN